jgi:hypothetical protein
MGDPIRAPLGLRGIRFLGTLFGVRLFRLAYTAV